MRWLRNSADSKRNKAALTLIIAALAFAVIALSVSGDSLLPWQGRSICSLKIQLHGPMANESVEAACPAVLLGLVSFAFSSGLSQLQASTCQSRRCRPATGGNLATAVLVQPSAQAVTLSCSSCWLRLRTVTIPGSVVSSVCQLAVARLADVT